MKTTPPQSPSRLVIFLVRASAACLILFFVTAWVRTALTVTDDPAVLERDWTAFHQAGQMLLAGEAHDIYSHSLTTPLPFAYPPFALYLLAPLGLLGKTAAYLACTVGGLILLLATLLLLRQLLPAPRGEHLTLALVALSSAPWIATIVVGQLTPLYLLTLTAGFLLLRRRRDISAGLVLSLLLIKPNFGIVLAGVLVWQRRWRTLSGFALGTALLYASTLPLGRAIWTDYLAASRFMVAALGDGSIPLWKHQTLLAALATMSGTTDPAVVRPVWAAIVAGLLTCFAWIFRRRVPRPDLPRLLAVTVLVMVVCNPYTYFYDALLLLIPAAVWYLRRERYAHAQTHRLIGSCLLATYVSQHVSLFVLPGMPALAGLTASAWLAGELTDRWRANRPCLMSQTVRPVVPEMPRPPVP